MLKSISMDSAGQTHLVVEDLLQAGIAFLRHHGILDDRHQARIELEHHRARATVRQVALDHIYERSDVIGSFVPVCPPLQLDGYYRHVVARGRCQLFQAIDGCEAVFDELGHIGLDLAGGGPGVGGHHRDERRIHLRELVDRQA